jgi:hypothetical protein
VLSIFLIAAGWPLAPTDTLHALGNNWGEYQEYGYPYLHPGIDVMGITVGKPVFAVDSGVVKAWLTTAGEWHWRLAIADYETSDSVEAWLYAHIDANLYHKNVGDTVAEAELIGYLVEWPVTGFDHVHFARIKDAGAVWLGSWAFIENPLNIITPYDDTTKPVFENAYGGNKFAFCQNNTSMYLSPNNLNGSVDIIAKIYDDVGLPLPYPVWERLIPYKIEYEIHGQQNLPTTLSFVFAGVLHWTDNVDVIYKDDATCNSDGDYEYRNYYFIITNTDGDSIIEASDAAYAWITTDFPDGEYWVVVTAYDAADNATRDSMLVTVNNMGIAEEKSPAQSLPFSILPNPNNGTFVINSDCDVKILDITDRLIAFGRGLDIHLIPGVYFVIYEQKHEIFCSKVIVVNE